MTTRRLRISILATLLLAALSVGLPSSAYAAPDEVEQVTEITATPLVTDPSTPNRDNRSGLFDPQDTRAGAHPDLRIHMRFCGPVDGSTARNYRLQGCSGQLKTQLRDFILSLPPGLLGNPTSVPIYCPNHLWLANSCPPETQVGYSPTFAVPIGGGTAPVPTKLFALDPLGFEPARLGTDRIGGTPLTPLPILIGLRTAGDLGIDSFVKYVPRSAGLFPAEVMSIDAILFGRLASGKYFMTNPTSCKPVQIQTDVSSWAEPSVRTVGQSEKYITQVVTVNGATGGTFTLTYKALITGVVVNATSPPIPYNATAAEVQAALEAATAPPPRPFTVGAGNVKVTDGPTAGSYRVRFADLPQRAGGAVSSGAPLLTAIPSFTGGTGTVGVAFDTVETAPYTTTGCNDPQATPSDPTPAANPPFDLNVDVKPDDTQRGAPSGYTVKLHYPDYADADIWQGSLRDAVVTLPDGVSLATGGGVGLEACSFEQFYGPDVHSSGDYDLRTDDPVECSPSSQIGTIKVESPALPEIGTDSDGDPYDIEGKAFFGPTGSPGRPTASKPWKLFLLLEGHGLRIKLPAGDVTVNESGQITTAFFDNPEVPFKTFKLHTNDGPQAPLANPRSCGEHTGQAVLTSWGDADDLTPSRIVSPKINITDSGSCDEPFQPLLEDASAQPTQAGASSVSHLAFTRGDGQQYLSTLNLSLPPGAVGSLAAVPLCPAATVRALESNPGLDCPESSKVGRINTTVGTQDGLLTVPGKVYIGEAVRSGAAASFVIVIPSKVGPIDLGRVVVVNHAVLRPSDTGVDVLSPPIPTILEGVPLPVRKIDILVDREGFFLNPTNCNRHLFVATFTGDRGAGARGEFPTQATGCGALAFAPKLRLIAGGSGGTRPNSNTPLKAIVTQEPGEANIAKARVVVPDLIRPDVPQIQKPGTLCNDAQLAARACPASSQIGTARVITPVLPFTLSGPVYIVLKAGSPLPNLAVFLRGGGIEVLLSAGNGFQGIKILNTFDNVPDVPQSRFELNVNGGANGILLAHSDLCAAAQKTLPEIDARFTGQNGKVAASKPRLEIDGCVGASSLRRAYISKRSVRMSRNGTVGIKVTCPNRARTCAGQLSIQTARSVRSSARLRMGSTRFRITRARKVVKVKLSKRARKLVLRKRFVRSRVQVRITGGTTSQRTITIRSPR